MAKKLETHMPLDAKRCPDLSQSSPPPTDRRIGTPEVDRECLPTIKPMPDFEKAEDALKKGGKGYSRGSTTDAEGAGDGDD